MNVISQWKSIIFHIFIFIFNIFGGNYLTCFTFSVPSGLKSPPPQNGRKTLRRVDPSTQCHNLNIFPEISKTELKRERCLQANTKLRAHFYCQALIMLSLPCPQHFGRTDLLLAASLSSLPIDPPFEIPPAWLSFFYLLCLYLENPVCFNHLKD